MEELTQKKYRRRALKIERELRRKHQQEIERRCNRQEVHELVQLLLEQVLLLKGN